MKSCEQCLTSSCSRNHFMMCWDSEKKQMESQLIWLFNGKISYLFILLPIFLFLLFSPSRMVGIIVAHNYMLYHIVIEWFICLPPTGVQYDFVKSCQVYIFSFLFAGAQMLIQTQCQVMQTAYGRLMVALTQMV